MEILIAQPYLVSYGGAEKFVLKLAQHYDAKVSVVKYDPKRTYGEFKNVDIIQEGKFLSNFKLGAYYWNLKVPWNYDLIISNLAPSDLIRNNNSPVLCFIHDHKKGLLEPFQLGIPFRSRFSYFIGNMGYRFLLSKLTNKFEVVATNSNYNKQILKTQLHRKDIEVVHSGVELNDYYNNDYDNYFLFVGRLDPQKRIELAIRAYKRFYAKNKKFKLVLVLSGSAADTYFDKIKKEIGLNKDIKILWNVNNSKLKEIYANATAILFTSKNESFGLVPIEAMASYKPVISFNEGGPKETIVNGKTGFLVDSAEDMEQKMNFLAENPSIVEEMGKEARKHVEREFSWQVFFKKFDRLIYKAYKAKEK